jgi:hypothetical protein
MKGLNPFHVIEDISSVQLASFVDTYLELLCRLYSLVATVVRNPKSFGDFSDRITAIGDLMDGFIL